MRRLRGGVVVLAFLAAGCASTAESRPAGAPPDATIAFEGASPGSEPALLAAAKRELDAFQTAGRRATDLDDAAYAMRGLLRREGRADATVVFRPDPPVGFTTHVLFVVDAGPVVRLAEIKFTGVTVFQFDRLRARFGPTRDPASDDEPPVFRRSVIDAGVAAVEGDYLAEGYLRAKVGPAAVARIAGGARASVVVPVEEGRRYVVRAVRVEGETEPALRDRVEAIAATFVGRPYSARLLAAAVAAVRAEFGADGRLSARVSAVGDVDDDQAVATVVLRVRSSPRTRVGKIAVVGARRTEEDFVVTRTGLREDAILTRKALEAAHEGAYATGLFKGVTIERRPHETEDDVVPTDLEIAIEEVQARSVDLELGFGSYELLRGAARYRDRNLFGRGRTLEAATTASLKGYGGDLKFFDPYLLGPKNTFEAFCGYRVREEPSFDGSWATAEFAVRRILDRETSVRAGYRFGRSEATHVDVSDPTAVLPDGAAIVSSPFVDFEHDARDDPFNPTDGVLASAGLAWSGSAIGADLDFVEAYAALAAYWEPADGTVLAAGFRARNRAVPDDAPPLPIQERFFLGGGGNVRSFGESELGPSDLGGEPLGGVFALDASVELRQRLVGDLWGAVFYDVGTVGLSSFDVGGPYGHAVGAGLRYLLPFGPIRLDVAYNPGPLFASDDDWAVHFSFGFSF
jgi:outer membrane protein assembly complex protein YaeT